MLKIIKGLFSRLYQHPVLVVTVIAFVVLGSAVWAKKKTESVNSIEINTAFTDPRDGNHYSIITIDGINWFADDLRYISSGSFFQDTAMAGEGNFYSAEDKELICPEGWRLPQIADWEKAIRVILSRQQVSSKRLRANPKHKKMNFESNKVHFYKGYNPLKLSPDGRIDKGKHVKFGLVDYWVGHAKSSLTHAHISSRSIHIHSHAKEVVEKGEMLRWFKVKCVCEAQ